MIRVAKLEQFKCDGCGKLRTEDVNHWWTVFTGDDGVKFSIGRLSNVDESTEGDRRLVHVLIRRVARSRFDFCGQQCALAFISAQMAGGK
jgi:hypothetical protein